MLRPIRDAKGDVIGAEVVDETAERLVALEEQNATLLAKLATATTLAQVRKAAADIIAEG